MSHQEVLSCHPTTPIMVELEEKDLVSEVVEEVLAKNHVLI